MRTTETHGAAVEPTAVARIVSAQQFPGVPGRPTEDDPGPEIPARGPASPPQPYPVHDPDTVDPIKPPPDPDVIPKELPKGPPQM